MHVTRSNTPGTFVFINSNAFVNADFPSQNQIFFSLIFKCMLEFNTFEGYKNGHVCETFPNGEDDPKVNIY